MIEDAYTSGASLGLAVWCEDEAGPFQTVPHPGPSWRPQGRPARQPHEYVRDGTAKVMTLFRPADGRVRVEGATSVTNAVLHPWAKRELTDILAELPAAPPTAAASRAAWERWQSGLTAPITLPQRLPPLRVLLVLDNLAGHKTPAFVLWLFAHGIMPLFTPLGGSWLNMAEIIHPDYRPSDKLGWSRGFPCPGRVGPPTTRPVASFSSPEDARRQHMPAPRRRPSAPKN